MRQVLNQNWQFCECNADTCFSPEELYRIDEVQWLDAVVPGTVASSLQHNGLWSMSDDVDFDAKDWWYRTSFELLEATDISETRLHFEGLATLCDIWLNGELVACSQNMFLPVTLPESKVKTGENQLYLHFKSLNKALSEKKPRPKWKTNLVENQKLRYFRTSLIGRIPGWSANPAPVGPWRAIEINSDPLLLNLKAIPTLVNTTGKLSISFEYPCNSEVQPEFQVLIGDFLVTLNAYREGNRYICKDVVEVKDVKPWWPHTHGKAVLYPCQLLINQDSNSQSIELSPVGFKYIELETAQGSFALTINGKRVFCRGACWTPTDVVSMNSDAESLRITLKFVKDSGANMIRIGGTMIYATKVLLALCDELGIMVWQDFQFANMDYPAEDEIFSELVKSEVNYQIGMQSSHACLTLYCGNSEVDQQATMMGYNPAELKDLRLPKLIEEVHHSYNISVPLISSSPVQGSLPFHTNEGVAHYYAIGAYKKALTEVRQHNVQFTSECMGFSNVPQRMTRDQMFSGKPVVMHDPVWKAGIPRDNGAGWDFEDIRDFYLTRRFGIDAVTLRSQDTEKYLRLSEVVSGEMMSRVMQEWRSMHSNCTGALIWFLKDLKPGAGWGIIDSFNRPKASYYLLKQCWQPVCIAITDEGLNGLHFHVINESADRIEGKLILRVISNGNVEVVSDSVSVDLEAGSTQCFDSTSILGQFFDINYCYKFGPLKHEVVSVELVDKNLNFICENYYFVDGREVLQQPNAVVVVEAFDAQNDCIELKIEASHFLYRVNLDLPGYIPDDNFFNLLPSRTKYLTLRPVNDPPHRFRGYMSAINLEGEIRIAPPVVNS